MLPHEAWARYTREILRVYTNSPEYEVPHPEDSFNALAEIERNAWAAVAALGNAAPE